MSLLRFVIWMFPIGMMVVGAGVVSGQDYPSKPIRVVTGGAGGGNDFILRLITPGLAASLGQPVSIDYRSIPVIIAETVIKAPADGYTLLFYSDGLWTLPLMQKVPYDPVSDFSPITLAATSPMILAVHPSLPVKSVKELIALAKVKPGQLNFAATTASGPPRLSAELLKIMTGIDITHIKYKTSGQAVIALISGEVQLMFATVPAVAPHTKSGRLRALAITSAQPSALAPGLPTAAASGLPGYESATTYGLFAVAKTPAAIIGRLNREAVRLLNDADVIERMLGSGLTVVASSPEQLRSAIAAEMLRVGKVIKSAGIRAEE